MKAKKNMKKVILNKCYGGFGVSVEAYKLYAKKKGLSIYFYNYDYRNSQVLYEKTEDPTNKLFFHCFIKDMGDNVNISDDDYKKYSLWLWKDHREDPTLIEVIEELGEKASSPLSDLRIVKIPSNLDYVIDEYDGIETLHEKVREW